MVEEEKQKSHKYLHIWLMTEKLFNQLIFYFEPRTVEYYVRKEASLHEIWWKFLETCPSTYLFVTY